MWTALLNCAHPTPPFFLLVPEQSLLLCFPSLPSIHRSSLWVYWWYCDAGWSWTKGERSRVVRATQNSCWWALIIIHQFHSPRFSHLSFSQTFRNTEQLLTSSIFPLLLIYMPPPAPTLSPPLINSRLPFISLPPPVEAFHSLNLFPLAHSPLSPAPSQAFSLIHRTDFFSSFPEMIWLKCFNGLQQMA